MAIISKPPPAVNVSEENRLFFENELQESLEENLNNFIHQLHELNIVSVYFNDLKLYFEYVKKCLQGSTEIVSLIFAKPHTFSEIIYKQNLAHRLSVFIFYWGARFPPSLNEIRLHEPLRAIVITRPRRKA